MIVLDIETTGVDPAKHAIVSVGAVEFDPVKLGFTSGDTNSHHGARNSENQFYQECRVWEGAEIMQAALGVNGFTREEVTDTNKQSLQELMKNLIAWAKECKQHTIAGHNVHFDLNFLEDAVDRYDLDDFFHKRTVDTHSLTWMHMIKEGKQTPTKDKHSAIDSDFVFDYVGIDHERDTHNALEDAKLTAEAISRLLYNEKLFAEFA